jgi:SAM-dependent methyltransferase
MKRPECEWQTYVLNGYRLTGLRPGARVLDLGCGGGVQLADLVSHGARAIGIDLSGPLLAECRKKHLTVMQGRAEQIPLRDASVDGILCKAVVPYTDEPRVFCEIGRVLKEGALAYCIYLGAGYYLRSALYRHYWKYRVYGTRSLVNTWVYALSGLKLPGFLGDTVYQSRRRLAGYYRHNRLELVDEPPARTFLGFPVFIYHVVRKIGP